MIKPTNKTRNTALLTLSLATALAHAAPEIHSNFNLNYDIGVYTTSSAFAAPLDISLPAVDQVPMDFIGDIPDNTVVISFFPEQTSSDFGRYEIQAGSDGSILAGTVHIVHQLSDPTTPIDFVAPAIFAPGDTIGPIQNTGEGNTIAVNQTIEGGFDYLWFTPQRFIVGVAIQQDAGTHYGFIEFEDVRSYTTPSRRNYQPVRWGYETNADTAIVVPADCGTADTNRDNTIDFFDVSVFLDAYADTRYAADLNLDGTVNFFDISLFLAHYTAGCP